MGIKSRTFDVPAIEMTSEAGRATGGRAIRVKLTGKEKRRVEKMIRGAKNLQEIARLEKELNEGQIPGGALSPDEDSDEDRMEM
jgi:U2 small nuclear ribonucleoprotein A'